MEYYRSDSNRFMHGLNALAWFGNSFVWAAFAHQYGMSVGTALVGIACVVAWWRS